jgi:transglutaminase-like putative cysteine protease
VKKVALPLRILLLGVAAWCSAAALTGTVGTIAAVVGAIAGVLLGEFAARRPWRMWVIAAAGALVALIAMLLAAVATRYDFIPRAIGPARALRLSSILRYGAVALAAVTVTRVAARRIVALGVIEIGAIVAAVALPFAAHRDGQITRPQWLSDWAWRHAIDPGLVVVAIGVGVAALLALLLMLESPQRPRASSFAALPVLAVIAVLLLSVKSTVPPAEQSEQGRELSAMGDPPKPQAATGSNAWNGSGNQQNQGSNGGQQQQHGQQQQQQNQGSNGKQGQQQPPPPSEWQDPSSGGNKAQPMAVVLLGDDYQPPIQAYMFREETWSELYNGRLVSPRDRMFDPDIPRGEPYGSLKVNPPADAPGMKLLHATVALLVPHRKILAIGEPAKWGPVENPDPTHFVNAYKVESAVSIQALDKLLGRKAGDDTWAPELLDYYLQLPDDPRYAKLAQEIVDQLPPQYKNDPFARAAAINQYVGHNVSYSLLHRHANVPDPVADFLFGDRIGYCVHIAHATVYLWRAAGIPARVGVGYRVEADHQRGSSIIIRSGEAHAWPELYISGVGWMPFDVAPEKNLDPPGTPTDDDQQEKLAELARGKPPVAGTDKTVGPPPQKRALAGPLALGGAAIAGVILLALYAIKLWRRLAPSFAPVPALPRVAYRAGLDVLADAGHARAIGETRERFARRLAGEAPAFAELTTLHLAASLGPPNLPRRTRREWLDLLGQLRAELAARAKPARRFVRKLHPISFRASR